MAFVRAKRLDELSIVTDSLHRTPQYQTTGLPMVRVADVKQGFLNLSNTLRVDESTFAEFTHKARPQREDIVVSRVGTYGITSFVATDEAFCLGQNTSLIRPNNCPRYLYYALQCPSVKNEIEAVVVGSTQKH